MFSTMRTKKRDMMDREVSFRSGGFELAGSFRAPEEASFPAALILAGSGPLDRDGNAKRMPLSISLQLAESLAEIGWATLRYDKRGVGRSGGEYLPTGLYDELEDASAAYHWLVSQPRVDKVVVIGHSMGASYAAELAVAQPDLCGIVMLSGTAKTGEETLLWQTKKVQDTLLPKPILTLLRLFGTDVVKQQAKSLAKIKATTTDVSRIGLAKVNAKWTRELIAYDPEPALSKVETKVLAITGSKDVQVDPADLAEIARLVPGASTFEIPDVDHLLRYEEGAHSNVRKYRKQIRNPIDERVLDEITRWLTAIL